MAKIAVVGASGFVGGYVLRALLQQGHAALAVCRCVGRLPEGVEARRIADYGDPTALRGALRGADAVVHVAGRAHRSVSTATHRRVCERANCDQPLIAARAALEAGIPRFVFTSSIAVHGRRSAPGQALTANSPLAPVGAYGAAKLRAERGLRALSARYSLELSCVRPPLVYAPGAPGNFARLLRLVARARILPFGAVNNRRSLLAAENLAALLVRAAVAEAPPPLALVASDEPALSTRELTNRLALAMGRQLYQVAIPPPVLRCAASLLGQGASASKLLDDLVVCPAEARQRLGYQAVVCPALALRRAAQGCLGNGPHKASPSR